MKNSGQMKKYKLLTMYFKTIYSCISESFNGNERGRKLRNEKVTCLIIN